MGTLVSFVMLALVGVAMSLGKNSKRRIQNYKFRLIPNCLLTRFPIIFITGKQSLFYHGSYWNMIPTYLIEHGYEVLDYKLPWRKPELRMQELTQLADVLVREKTPGHWIFDASSKEEIHLIQKKYPTAFRSLRMVDSAQRFVSPFENWNLFLHNFTFGRRFPLDPIQLGVIEDASELRDIAQPYLELAKDLAEFDHIEDTPYARGTDAAPQP